MLRLCINSKELPHGSKTPSLTMHAPPKPGLHTMAAISPLYPGQHVNNMIGHNSGSSNSALNAPRTSTFAAALRKLAKQAVDPVAVYIPAENLNCTRGYQRDVNRCYPCPPGHYDNGSQTHCLPCPGGTYMTSFAADACVACPDDEITDEEGADNEDLCRIFQSTIDPR
ncbi:uncharacterized protein LOC143222661 isoform X1 [Tachypleus tridentatus]|uniref:uncharacterized protein LOC143222661 isoform X1 n=2 Tax=Tachypleus tridentatus TaxID=6853 RepID=UPI003FD0280B